jgi:hypothetical protein
LRPREEGVLEERGGGLRHDDRLVKINKILRRPTFISPAKSSLVHTHVDGHGGVCSVGRTGTVTRVLEGRAYLKNVAEAEDMMIV